MRRMLVLALVCLFLTIPLLCTPAFATPTATNATDAQSTTHTLVIVQKNGSVGYTVTVGGDITLKNTESGDNIAGNTVSGRVGGLPWKDKNSDSKDIIKYTGKLRDFEYDGGKIRLTLDGKQINPDKLVGTPPPPPPTPTSTPTPTTETATPPPTTEPFTTTDTPTATTQATTSNGGTSSGSDGPGLLDQMFPIVTGLAALGAVLYVLFGDG